MLTMGSLNLESFFYFRDSADGSVSSAYVKRGQEAVCGESAVASYNTFLGLDNWLRLSGVSGDEVLAELVQIDGSNQSGIGIASSLTLQ